MKTILALLVLAALAWLASAQVMDMATAAILGLGVLLIGMPKLILALLFIFRALA
jgi:hypothetical protein